MPQQRRKVPFSGKKKKDQLLQKRNTKGPYKYLRSNQESYEDSDAPETTTDRKVMEQPFPRGGGGRHKNVNRYNLQFVQESKKEIELMKEEGFKPLEVLAPKQREIDSSFFKDYDFPVRPPWNYEQSKELLERNENRYFKEYVDKLMEKRTDVKGLSLFELNLETWRQLWRVLEMSDILLIIVDVRYASLMFPPSLYHYIVHTLQKHAIVVLNKVDLVAPEAVVAWRHYFKEHYPEVHVVIFASHSNRGRKANQRGRRHQSMEGVYNIYRECQRYVQGEVDLSAWEQKIRDDMRNEELDMDDTTAKTQVEGELKISNSIDTTPHQHEKYNSGILTIGCLGYPNVGKSSLINALKGRKVVSVSRTPGHTKHFQTIFLSQHVRVCDCPGLVFPSNTPKSLQVLLGSFPISQLQVPYRTLKLMAEHLDVPQLLRLPLPEDYPVWSAVAIADAWAYKRGFLTAKAARPDRYRAANHILRMCLAGQQQLVLQFYPPGYHEEHEKWQQHPELAEVKKYQHVDADEPDSETNEDTSSICSDTADSDDDDEDSSNDETNADEDDCEKAHSRNVFALLEDD